MDTDKFIITLMSKPWANTYSLLKAIGASSAVIDETWRDYRRKYMRSQRWQDIRTKALERACRACEQCGRRQEDGFKLDVHHLTYIRLGGELMEDVQVLCYLCHGQMHYRRKVRQDAPNNEV